jgi:hypothetical protein
MAIDKQILEWQAAHPNTAWLAWGVAWLVILSTLFWPLCRCQPRPISEKIPAKMLALERKTIVEGHFTLVSYTSF